MTGDSPSQAAQFLRPAHETSALCDILEELSGLKEEERVSVNDVLEAFEDRSNGVLITVVGLLAALPVIGAIPGISITTGTMLILIVTRAIFGGGRLRLPGRAGRLSIDHGTLETGIDKFRPLARWIDAHTGRRLSRLSRSRTARTAILVCVAILSATMMPLAFVPWGVTPPAFGIVAFGLALLSRDGLLALMGYGFVAGTAALAIWII